MRDRAVVVVALAALLAVLAAATTTAAHATTPPIPAGWNWTYEDLNTARMIAQALQEAPLGVTPTQAQIDALWERLQLDAGLGHYDTARIARLLDDLNSYINLGGGDPALTLDEATSLLGSIETVESVPPSVAPWSAGDAYAFVQGDVPPVSPPSVLNPASSVSQQLATDMTSAQQDLGMLTRVGGGSTLTSDGTIEAVGLLDMIPGDLIAYGATVVIAFKLTNGYFMRWAVPIPAMPSTAHVTVSYGSLAPDGGRSLAFVYNDGGGAWGPNVSVADEPICASWNSSWSRSGPDYQSCNVSVGGGDTLQGDTELWQAWGDSSSVPNTHTGRVDTLNLTGGDSATYSLGRYYRSQPGGVGVSGSPESASVPVLEPPSYDPAGEGAVVVPLDGTAGTPNEFANPTVTPDQPGAEAKIRAAIAPTLAPFVDGATDPNRPVDPTTGAGGAPVAGGASAGGAWVMPSCRGETYSACYDAIVAAAPSDVVVHPKEAAAYDPAVDVGSVVQTDPAGGSTTKREVYVVTNPAAPVPAPIVIPPPNGFETYAQYVYRLRRLGWLGTVTGVPDGTNEYLVGPHVVVQLQVQPAPTTADPSPAPLTVPVWDPVPAGEPEPQPHPWPTTPIEVPPDSPITITITPPDAPPAPIPDPGPNPNPPPQPGPTPSPNPLPGPGPLPPPGSPPPPVEPPAPPNPPPSPGGGSTLDFGPLQRLDFGCKFPFGFVCYAREVTAWFNVEPVAPEFSFNIQSTNALIGNHVYDVDLGHVGTSTGSLAAPHSLSDYMAVLRLLMSVALWVGAVYAIATRLLRFDAAGDPGEAVDEGLPW